VPRVPRKAARRRRLGLQQLIIAWCAGPGIGAAVHTMIHTRTYGTCSKHACRGRRTSLPASQECLQLPCIGLSEV
jgi:hypothetical protein